MSRPTCSPDPAPRDLQRFAHVLRATPVRQGRFDRLLRAAVRLGCRLSGWQVRVTRAGPLPQRGSLPGSGCVIVVVPHRAWLEPFLVAGAWPRGAARLVWLADGRTATRSWWRRRFLPRLGVIPIAMGGGGPRAYADQVAAACARGQAVVVFPEVGPPSAPDRTRRISPGFAYLALRAGAPIVPVVVAGTHHIVRGSAFSVDMLPAIDPGTALAHPFTATTRRRAHDLAGEFEAVVSATLAERTRWTDAQAPDRDRWPWLARLFG